MLNALRILIEIDVDLAELKVAGEQLEARVDSAMSENPELRDYVDQLDIAVLSDDATFKDTHEATDAMVHAFAEIRRACGLAEPTIVDTAMAPATAAF